MRKYMEKLATRGSFLANCGPTVRANSSMRKNLVKRERKLREMIRDEDKLAVSLLLYLSQSPGKPQVEVEAEVRKCALTLLHIKQSQQNQSEEEEEEAKDEVALELSPRKEKRKANKEIIADQAGKQEPKKKKVVDVDDSEQTLEILLDWNETKPENPRREMLVHDPEAVGVCSELMRKQLMGSDVKGDQCRLMLGKKEVEKMMLRVMGKSERVGTNGFEVSVYGPDGEVHKMMFKMWSGGNTPVLTSTVWNKFVADYDLKKHCDFLTIWMFKHRETRKICFAIDSTRFPSITKKLSQRILKAVF